MDRALAASGVLVVAIDMTLAPEAPYPACVQDANYGVRWLKCESRVVERRPVEDRRLRQLERRPRRRAARRCGRAIARYNAIPLPEAPNVDATVAYVAMRSPISDPFARFQNAERLKRDAMMKNHTIVLQAVGDDPRKQSAGDPRAPRGDHAGAAADHAGRARRQRAAGRAGEVRRDLQGGRRRVRVPRVRGLRARVGRHAGAADRPRPRDGQGVHRAAHDQLVPRRTIRY